MEKQTNRQTLAHRIADFFQKFGKRGGDEKNRVNPLVILAIAAAALTLVFIKPGTGKDGAQKSEPAASSDFVSEDEYVIKTERELRDILSKISGAGEVSVRIYIDSTNEKVLAKDSKTSSEISESESGKKESSTGESKPAGASGGIGSGSEPYVVREKLPYPIGVVVVAEGASDERVRNEIYEAVKALYGLSANRIKVTY